MKIRKFSNAENELSSEVEDYILNFEGSVEDNIPEWIASVAKSANLEEYKYCTLETEDYKKLFNFIEKKGFKNFKQFAEITKTIRDLYQKINELEEIRDEIKFLSDSELLLRFQEDLLEKDSNIFYKFFIDTYEDGSWVDDFSKAEVHPDLVRKYGGEKEFLKQFEHIPASKKYNL